MRKFLSLSMFASMLLAACSGPADKGDEEDLVSDYEGKFDSFRKPTLHGDLLFGVPLRARMIDGETFHAWDFELSDSAQVSLETQLITANLDTVMYVYKWDEAREKFGRYKFKNDDANDDTVASALDLTLSEGQYRVLVKAYKRKLRGAFDLVAECEGEGCAKSTCDVATFDGLPEDGSDSCGELFSEALNSSVIGGSSTFVTLNDRCSLPDPVSAAVEEYVEFFGGPEDFEENFNFGDPDEPVEVDVEWTMYANGAFFVGVDGGGDEASFNYLISPEGQIIAHFWHNQSPDHTLYCDDFVFSEDGECFFEYTENYPHRRSDERSIDQDTLVGEADELEPVVANAVFAYAKELELDDSAPVLINGVAWDIGDQESVARLTLSSPGQDRFVLELEALSNTQFLFTKKRADEDATYVCEEL